MRIEAKHSYRDRVQSQSIDLPQNRAVASALFVDEHNRTVLVEPTYKGYRELPGGAVEVGESPYAAAVREVDEELGLAVHLGGLLVSDWVPATSVRPDGVIFVFDGGPLPQSQRDSIVLPAHELRSWAWCDTPTADRLLSPLLARRTRWARLARRAGSTFYL